ncbi:saccharopine dehydrogenase NADP-binding domain-containing protein [Legionella sp.]|uniref:saccharopine dehydrogenase family protein n=1 Tax=Legionella sp. TaxID=459 RepID=UPI000CB2CBAE|nr:saccharopine dehydrogenase NADP-binding domain-containing protein [Legionella sp.]PJE10574.1 MAG: potassium transporter [Legionella sp.]
MELTRVFIVGGYGNFGQYIARALSLNPRIKLIIGGRQIEKAKEFSKQLPTPVEIVYCDIFDHFATVLRNLKPDIVIHTSGPFQIQGYQVAQACLAEGAHYIDLADSRDFVTNISQFHAQALEHKKLICSGASSVPGLSSAIIEHYLPEFKELSSVDYAIATAQLTNQGLATTTGVLSYAGKPFETLINGQFQKIYGWQDLRLLKFWRLNKRFLGNCDIPDLALFPQRYPTLQTLRFQAGLELKFLHVFLFLFSWLVRLRLLPPLNKFASPLLKISHFFNWLGTNNSGFYMLLQGLDPDNRHKTICFEITAQEGDGLYIPCIPAIYLSEQIASGQQIPLGALPCAGLISLDNYLEVMKRLGLKIAIRQTISVDF